MALRDIPLIACVIAATPLVAAARPTSPGFADYPAVRAFHGARARLRIRGAHSRLYAGALAEAAAGPVDFDGRYILAQIGCGAGCIEVAAIDAATGSVAWFPASISNWPTRYLEPLEYRTNSRLVIVQGQLGETGGAGPRSFVFDGRRFALSSPGAAASRPRPTRRAGRGPAGRLWG